MWLIISLIMMSFVGFRLVTGLMRGRIIGWMNIPFDRATDRFGFWEYVVTYAAFLGGFLWLAIHVVASSDL